MKKNKTLITFKTKKLKKKIFKLIKTKTKI